MHDLSPYFSKAFDDICKHIAGFPNDPKLKSDFASLVNQGDLRQFNKVIASLDNLANLRWQEFEEWHKSKKDKEELLAREIASILFRRPYHYLKWDQLNEPSIARAFPYIKISCDDGRGRSRRLLGKMGLKDDMIITREDPRYSFNIFLIAPSFHVHLKGVTEIQLKKTKARVRF